MLDALRKSSAGIVAKVLLGLLVISFAIWGIGDIFRGVGANDVAQVGEARIPTETFRQEYQERLQQVGQQMGRGVTPQQARAFGLDRQVLGEMISEATLDAKAKQLGLNVSNEDLVARIHNTPAFKNAAGQFDPNRFYEVLRNANFTEARYLDSERRLMLRQQMGRALSADLAAPQVLREALRRYEAEERSVQFIELTADQAKDIPPPTPEVIDAYFKDNATSFRAPEYRKLVVLALTPDALASEVKITDEELKTAYERVRDRLGEPERRELDQIVAIDATDAEKLAERFAGGAKFEEIVAERKLNNADISLGLVAKREIVDAAVADAAFNLAIGEVSKPVRGAFGTVFLRVSKIEPGKQPTFDEIKEPLRQDIALSRARNMILDRHDKIEDERAAGSHLAEVGQKIGLKPITIEAVDRSGRGPDGKPIENVPGLRQVLDEAFTTDVGDEADPIEIDRGSGYVWYEVAQITPSRDQKLEEIRDRVEARWRDEQVGKILTERAEAIRAKLDAGESFAVAAPDIPFVQTREKIKRSGTVDGLDRSAITAIFQTPNGKAGVANRPDDVGLIVYRVTGVETPAGAADADKLSELNIGLQDDVLVEYVLDLQGKMGVRVNQQALQSVVGGGDGN
jgi:peptidyl-prolyl cis-trans isomerase D